MALVADTPAWSPDGRLFATHGQATALGQDTTVRLWTATGQPAGTLSQTLVPWVLAVAEGSAVRLWAIAPAGQQRPGQGGGCAVP